MNNIHEMLLNNNTCKEEKYNVANNIIIDYNLPLYVDQILLAYDKVLDWLETCPRSTRNNRIFLFDKILNINKNMYIALILALCSNYNLANLSYLIMFTNGRPCDIGLSALSPKGAIRNYCKLLDYYEFDVSNISTISSADKKLIDDYRAEKYSNKLTKCAIKK